MPLQVWHLALCSQDEAQPSSALRDGLGRVPEPGTMLAALGTLKMMDISHQLPAECGGNRRFVIGEKQVK